MISTIFHNYFYSLITPLNKEQIIKTLNDVEIDVDAAGLITLYHPSLESPIDITEVLSTTSEDGSITNPINVSQFINIDQTGFEVDPYKAIKDSHLFLSKYY